VPDDAPIPLTVDRRLSNRILARWMMARGNRLYPRLSEIDPKVFGKDWVNCVLVQLAKDVERSRVVAIGQNLRTHSWSPTIPTRLHDYSDGSLLRFTTDEIETLIEQRALIAFGGNAFNRTRPIRYRGILLPLSDDGQTIDGALGAINFREVERGTRAAGSNVKSLQTTV
jgi:hypothetical protein